jgi:hypothetical protein
MGTGELQAGKQDIQITNAEMVKDAAQKGGLNAMRVL